MLRLQLDGVPHGRLTAVGQLTAVRAGQLQRPDAHVSDAAETTGVAATKSPPG